MAGKMSFKEQVVFGAVVAVIAALLYGVVRLYHWMAG